MYFHATPATGKKCYKGRILKMKRIMSVLLAMMMALSLFTACGDKIDENPGPAPAPAVSGDVTPETPPEVTAGEDVLPPEQTDNPPVETTVGGNPNPTTGETWNGYDLTFVKENGIEYIWERLSNEMKENLASAMTAIRDITGFITLKYPMGEEENYEFMQLILNCAMDYPYVRNRFVKHDNDEDGNIDALTIVFNYDLISTEAEGWEMTRRLNERVDEIVAGMPDGSEYEKLRYLHDTLVFNCTYSDSIPTFYTAYGALVDGQATCQGYADAMHLLLSRAGFETVWCVGVGSDEAVTHKWNYVKLSDGKWYILDPTWADPAEKDDPAYISYDYFLISDEELLKDHKEKHENRFFEEPVAESMEMNYHIQEGCCVSTYDEAKASIEKQILDCAAENRHYVYLRVTDGDVYDDIRDRMLKANRSDGSHGEIMQLLKDAVENNGVPFKPTSWSVYNGHEDGVGQYTFIINLTYAE